MPQIARFSLLYFLALFCPLALWADDPGAGAGGAGDRPPATDPAKAPPAITQADIDKAVQAATANLNTQWAESFKAATGHDTLDAFKTAQAKAKGEERKLLEERDAELAATKTQLAQVQISNALADAAVAAKAIDPATVVALLAAQGKVENGAITVGGKSAADAVAALLKGKPFLAQASGNQGGGTPASGGSAPTQLARADFEKLDPSARMKFVKDGGQVV